MSEPDKEAAMAARAARVDRLQKAICDCSNKSGGRHACTMYAEEASDAIDSLRSRKPLNRHRWDRIIRVIAQELKTDV